MKFQISKIFLKLYSVVLGYHLSPKTCQQPLISFGSGSIHLLSVLHLVHHYTYYMRSKRVKEWPKMHTAQKAMFSQAHLVHPSIHYYCPLKEKLMIKVSANGKKKKYGKVN